MGEVVSMLGRSKRATRFLYNLYNHYDPNLFTSFQERLPKPLRRAAHALLVLLAIAACVTLVYATGGTRYPYPHTMYVAIVVAAFLFRVPGGLLAGLAGGLALGPLMPLAVETGEMQRTTNWLFRTAFFLLTGGFTGALVTTLERRSTHLSVIAQTLTSTYAATLKSFTSLVEVYDEPTSAHCERVAANAYALGEALGLPEQDLERLYWAGILHDVGKVVVPSHILLKPGPLTVAEYDLVKAHARYGEELLASISEAFRPIVVGVGAHHERWDGSGYPRGLRGADIPLFGRLLAVVDVFEALTSSRPYRDPLPPEEALAHLRERAGVEFDAALVERYADLYEQGRVVVERSGGEWGPLEIPKPAGWVPTGKGAAASLAAERR